MTRTSLPAAPQPTVGFLTVLSESGLGLIGGYLLLNRVGRPLEFHCTAPVRPTRAQEILYGPTLEPYLYGEQIGHALLEKSGTQPVWVCTDSAAAMAARDFSSIPMAAFRTSRGGDELADGPAIELPDGNHLAVSSWHRDDLPRIEEFLREWSQPFDLGEPFGRIRDAIREAQRSCA